MAVFLTAIAAIAAASVLYQPILKIGLLSDDYALLMWARRLELLPRDWGQIRPLPILAWWVLAKITSPVRTPFALHAFNVFLHGVNATLVYVVAARLMTSRASGMLAAALFVTMPILVEPVAWGSGVFDVMLATFGLTLAVLVTRRPHLTRVDQALCLILSIAMLASKETGVIAGPLVLLLYWARWGSVDGTVVQVAIAQVLLVSTYAFARYITDRLDPRLTPRLDLAATGRMLSGITRAFVLPLHRDVALAHPILIVVFASFVVAVLIAWIIRCRRSPQMLRIVTLTALGTLLCVAPTIRIFGITPDLQGSRYVYLASAWWSIAVTAALVSGWQRPVARKAALAMAGLFVLGSTAVTRAHMQPWVAARTERDRVLRQLISIPPSCRQVAAGAATDNVAGAYVFRNGLNEALATLGRSYEWVTPDRAAPECVVNFDH